MMVNKRPVLIYQTRLAPIRVIVTISDIHLRDALYSDTDDNGLALWVQNQMIARYGDVKPLAADPHQEVFTSPAYSFRIAYPESLFFSLARLVNNVSGLLIFIFSVSLLFYFLMRKYLNVYTSEEEKLRYAITQGYIVPYYQPLVNVKAGGDIRRGNSRPLAKQHDASALARGIYSAGRTYRLNYSPNPQPDGAGQRADETTL